MSFESRFALVPILALLAGTSTVQAQATWTTPEIVAPSSAAMSALTFANDGTPHVGYFISQDDTRYIGHTQRNGGSWVTDGAIVDRGSNNPLGISVKVNDSGDPSIAYFNFANFDADYVAKTGSTWGASEHIATAPGAIGEYAHLALNATGTPLASFANATALFYGSKASGSWVVEQIAPKGIPAFLRVNESDQPVIAFVDATEVALKTATFNGVTWDIETAIADFSSGTAPSVSMALHDGNISISYRDAAGVNLVTKTGGVWNAPETVVVAENTIATGTTSIGVDFNGDTYIAFATTDGAVKVVDDTGGTWFVNTLAATNAGYNLAQGEALATRGHTVGVIFNNTTTNNIMFASAVVIPEAAEYGYGGLLALALAALRKSRLGFRKNRPACVPMAAK